MEPAATLLRRVNFFGAFLPPKGPCISDLLLVRFFVTKRCRWRTSATFTHCNIYRNSMIRDYSFSVSGGGILVSARAYTHAAFINCNIYDNTASDVCARSVNHVTTPSPRWGDSPDGVLAFHASWMSGRREAASTLQVAQ